MELNGVKKYRRIPALTGIWLTMLLSFVFVQVLVAQTEVTGEQDSSQPGQENEEVATQTAETPTINTGEGTAFVYLPIVHHPLLLTSLTLQASRPNNANQWTASWDDLGGGVSYELQESQDPGFGTITTYQINGVASYQLNHAASPYNVYYYRVRPIGGTQEIPWSNIVQVVGGYLDNFDDPNTGWALRRTTYIEQVRSFYEPGIYVIQIDDAWDWGIASPKALAPQVPYVIQYMSQPAHLGNLISHGFVFGGDWPGAICPDWSTTEGVYEHTLCFNHFYNTNTIWFGDQDLKLLWERVDQLIWCPECGGSPMKRLGDIDPKHPVNLHAGNASGWNTYRIEVREDRIDYYFNDSLEYIYTGTQWVHEPYFGVFASTDEYSNSTWRFEYVSVMPLDQ